MRSVLFLFLFAFQTGFSQTQPLRLWYKQPASATVPDGKEAFEDDAEWLKALPLGNGNTGAMIFGDVNEERIQLNEKTLWSGSPDENDNPEAARYLPEIRRLLFAGQFKEATELANKTQVCKGAGSGEGRGANVPFGCFQTLGDLRLRFASELPYTDYHRDLNLHTAIASVSYQQNKIHYKREYFISRPANVLVIRLTADQKGALSFTVSLNRPERYTTTVAGHQLIMSGALPNGKGGDGMEYMVRLKAKQKGGSKSVQNNQLVITNADEVILYLAASTDYLPVYPVYKGRAYKKISEAQLNTAFAADYEKLKQAHIKAHQYYFNRVSFQIAGTEDGTDLPTDERLKRIRETKNDNFLTQLYFQYGRYLLIASSAPGALPANLQGIWANKIQTPWNSDYHTNINVQMNYWPAETTGLGELHLSLTDFIQAFEKPATKSAAIQFGLPGWCINPIVNVWGFTSPGEHPSWGLTSGASGWICQHLWEHYAFTKDMTYLRRIYPTLKNAARFYKAWLVKDEVTGKLVSGPASSPENAFLAPDSSKGSISMGPSHDQEIIDELFGNVLQAAVLLHDNDAFIKELKAAKAQLLQPAIGEDGRILEWAKPYKELDPGHRHLSHLYALYPGHAFNNRETPLLVEAARKSLQYRLQHGGGHTGWSAAWITNLWARLKSGDEALKAYNEILIKKSADNLFDLHPPFQIDGNFGATAGIAEMLLQSQEGKIELLPALPSSWTTGQVKGLCARGGFVINMEWKQGRLTAFTVFSKKGGRAVIGYQGREFNIDTKAGKEYRILQP